jgi:hypothetical protein
VVSFHFGHFGLPERCLLDRVLATGANCQSAPKTLHAYSHRKALDAPTVLMNIHARSLPQNPRPRKDGLPRRNTFRHGPGMQQYTKEKRDDHARPDWDEPEAASGDET